MSCLGERLTALVDGELGHEERDVALAHLALCDRCRAEADALRRLKSRLRGLTDVPDPEAAPTGDFMARLKAMGEPDGPAAPVEPPARRPVGNTVGRPVGRSAPHTRARRSSRPRDNRPVGRAAAAAAVLPHAPRRRVLAVGAATLFLGFGAVSYAAGGQTRDTPTVSPAFEKFAVEHALVSGDAPMPDPLTDSTTIPLSPEP